MTKTSRETEQDRNENVLITSVFASIGIVVIALIIFYAIFVAPLSNKNKCNIGEDKIAGDYKIINPDLLRQCAIDDCVAFNKYNEQENISQRCVV